MWGSWRRGEEDTEKPWGKDWRGSGALVGGGADRSILP